MAALSCNVLILRVGTQHPVRGNAHRRSPRLSHPVPPAPLKLACHGSWASCGCCGHRGCVRSDVCPSAPPPPPRPPTRGIYYSAARRWMPAVAAAAAPLPNGAQGMPGSLIPAQSLHPLLGSGYSPWGGMAGV